MNAPLTTRNATSLAKQSALPDAWIDRIFQRFEGRYGSLFIDRWRGCDMANVRETWATELAGYADRPDCIAYALKSLSTAQFPPTLPEFIEACRRAPEKESLAALPHKLTPEDHERARKAAEQAVAALKPKHDGGIDRHWATHPRSHAQLKMIFDAAQRDPRFKPCIDEMVEKGICTEGGRLLKSYRDGEFQRCGA